MQLRFDRDSQSVVGQLNVETVNLDGVNPLVNAIVTPLVPVMGGIDDKRLAPLPGSAENIGGRPAPRLVLRGLVLMGGIEIKS